MNSSILLEPPPSLTVQEGTNITLPCVTLSGAPPNWTLFGNLLMEGRGELGMVSISQNSLDIVGVQSGGMIQCEVNGESAAVNLSVECEFIE